MTTEERKALVEAAQKGRRLALDAAIFESLANPSAILSLEAALTAAEEENTQLRSDCEWAEAQRKGNLTWAMDAEARATASEARAARLEEGLTEARASLGASMAMARVYRMALSNLFTYPASLSAQGDASSLLSEPIEDALVHGVAMNVPALAPPTKPERGEA